MVFWADDKTVVFSMRSKQTSFLVSYSIALYSVFQVDFLYSLFYITFSFSMPCMELLRAYRDIGEKCCNVVINNWLYGVLIINYRCTEIQYS